MKKSNSLKEFALKNNVPILSDEGQTFIIKLIKEKSVKSILEIGTAIGYSAISFALEGALVTSIERNEKMYLEACKNVDLFQFNDRITLINEDALLLEISTKFDLIFIDAAKAQYYKFFNKYKANLNESGCIVCDNLNFHNLDPNKVSRGTRQLLRKINEFKQYLRTNNEFVTSFYDIGDGMSVSVRNEKINNNL
ncbi:MAG: O-methyltransferase [Acholeplasma sp.]|nr:O-methyltransferase [Acholeplasma sp.]